jgi:hypothetical protein
VPFPIRSCPFAGVVLSAVPPSATLVTPVSPPTVILLKNISSDPTYINVPPTAPTFTIIHTDLLFIVPSSTGIVYPGYVSQEALPFISVARVKTQATDTEPTFVTVYIPL